MKLSKRILSAFLAILTVCSLAVTIGAANVTFTDVSGHWAWTGGQISYLVDKDVLNGYKQSNGTYKFMPDGEVTRAEFVKMLDETFGLTATTYINYSDVKSTDWFYTYFAKAAAQGYLLNYGSSVSPNGKITREEAISLLVRYLDLPANEKADVSYFSDYYSISENYRDYILRAIYAELTDGYNENGGKVFKPKNTLTRAEALTILYRAAGCIFNQNAYSRDNGAAATNNVITRGGVILNGVTLGGRVIVSEGADSGTVSLSKCTVADTLYIRGGADVVLDNCRVGNIIVTNGCKLSLQNDTSVENVILYGKTSLNVYSNVSVGTLTVENGAANTSVNGNGAISMAYINASGFTSSMVPGEFRIGNNLTATFASNNYQGSSDAQESFTMTPFVTSDESNYYLNLFPAVDGDVYYYFTNGSGAPNASTFDSYYASSSFTGMISVKAGSITTEKTYSASSVKNFEYVVLQLQESGRKYAPVIIPNTNTDGNGFSTAPHLAYENTIKFVAGEGGTLYWFYSESGERMTQAEFLDSYSKTESALRDSNEVISGRTLSIALNTKYLKNNNYIILMLKNSAGSYYTPVVVSAGDNGFVEGPSLKNVGTVSFKTSVNGELYYFYSKNADLPAPEDFKAEYNRADYAERFDVTKNKSDSFEYKSKYSDDYPYLIIALKSDGEYMQPVALNINYSTGFVVTPEIISETEIRFKTEDDGEVMYYYSKSEVVPSSEDFRSVYSNTASRYKDTVDVRDSYERVEYSQTYAQNYPYMAFMFIDDQENEYTPVVIKLDATSDTGFKITPYINGDAVFFQTEEEGEVWYYFSKDGSAVASSEFEDNYDDVSRGYLYGYVETSGTKINYFEIDDEVSTRTYPYIVIAFLADSDDKTDSRRFHYPVVLDIENSNIGGTGLSVDYIGDEEVTITTLLDGKVYYYFAKSSQSVSAKNFESRYDNGYEADYERCDDGEDFNIEFDKDDGYKYLVICVEVEDVDGNSVYLNPVVVDLSEKTSSGDLEGGATTGKTGLTLDQYSPADSVIKMTAAYSGTVHVYLYMDGRKISEIGSLEVEKKDTFEFDYSKQEGVIRALIGESGKPVDIVFQLENSEETYSTYSVPILY